MRINFGRTLDSQAVLRCSVGVLSGFLLCGCANDRNCAPQFEQAKLPVQSELEIIPGRIIVERNSSTAIDFAGMLSNQPLAVDYLQSNNLVLQREENHLSFSNSDAIIIEFPTGTDSAKRIDATIYIQRRLLEIPGVLNAELVYRTDFYSAMPNDPCFGRQWNLWNNGGQGDYVSLGSVNFLKAWENDGPETTPNDTIVAVVDTGLTDIGADLNRTAIVKGYDIGDNDADADDNSLQPHGTWVAGIIGLQQINNRVGGAPAIRNAKVMPVKYTQSGALKPFGENARSARAVGFSDDLAVAIAWSAGIPVNGLPINYSPARIINVSSGISKHCEPNSQLQAAINLATRQGALIVAASGPPNSDSKNVSPASCDNVLVAAGSDKDGAPSYSALGSNVDVLAPGGSFTSQILAPSAQNKIHFDYGSSFAAAHASSVAAIIARRSPAFTPNEIKLCIKKNATPIDGSKCAPDKCGAGLLNADVVCQ